MDKQKQQSFRATASSSGDLSINYNPSNQNYTDAEAAQLLGDAAAQIVERMLETGYIHFHSSSDIAQRYGNSRQYWEKLFNEGKIPYQKTSSGRISTNLWVEGYLTKSKRETYPKKVLEMRKRIIAQRQSYPLAHIVKCVDCNEDFDYNFNNGSPVNGICRKCGFKLNTII